MKIYISAAFNRKDEMRLLASQIESWTKHLVISRWHGRMGAPDAFEGKSETECALGNVDDLKEANILLSIGGPTTQGARLIEFGMAWAWNIQIIHLGEPENLFFHLDGIDIVPNRGAMMDALRENFHFKDLENEALVSPDPLPRYDAVFEAGVRELDKK